MNHIRAPRLLKIDPQLRRHRGMRQFIAAAAPTLAGQLDFATAGTPLSTAPRWLRTAARLVPAPYLSLSPAPFFTAGPMGRKAWPVGMVLRRHGDRRGMDQALDAISAEQRKRGAALAGTIRHLRLTHANDAPDRLPAGIASLSGPAVLVISPRREGKPWQDAGPDDDCGATMLAQARADHPGATVLWWGAGAEDRPPTYGGTVTLVTTPVSAWALIDRVDAVYTAGDESGFLALIAGKPVHCFGLPFYAGRGLTRDHVPLPPGRPAADLDALVYTSVAALPTYVHPFTGALCSAEDALAVLAEIRDAAHGWPGTKIFLWMKIYNRNTINSMAGPEPDADYTDTLEAAIERAKAKGCGITAWASGCDDTVVQGCAAAGVPLTQVEDGFLRSVGLGLRQMPAASLVFDDLGIYYDGRSPSRLERIIAEGGISADEKARAKLLMDRVVAAGLTKYNVGTKTPTFAPPPGRVAVLVAGQVENDMSIRRNGGDFTTNEALLRRVRERRPGAFIIYKPHPDVMTGLRPGLIPNAITAQLADVVCDDLSADILVRMVDEVHTISSLIGFEALMRGKRVATYGMPFYAGWGLTDDYCAFPRRRPGVTLEELVAAALIRYPAYIDPVTMLPCRPEVIIERLGQGITVEVRKTLRARMKRLYSRTLRAWLMRRRIRAALGPESVQP